jgi:hypothetical protein
MSWDGSVVSHTNREFSSSGTFEEASLMLVSPCLSLNHSDGLVLLSLMMWMEKYSHILHKTGIVHILILCVLGHLCHAVQVEICHCSKSKGVLAVFGRVCEDLMASSLDWNGIGWCCCDRIYKVFDLKNYNMLYSISDENVQEIKIRLVLKCNFRSKIISCFLWRLWISSPHTSFLKGHEFW